MVFCLGGEKKRTSEIVGIFDGLMGTSAIFNYSYVIVFGWIYNTFGLMGLWEKGISGIYRQSFAVMWFKACTCVDAILWKGRKVIHCAGNNPDLQ